MPFFAVGTQGMKVGKVPGLPDGENCMVISFESI